MKKIIGFILMLGLIMGILLTHVNAEVILKDTKKTDWYYKYLQYILNDSRNIIEGYPDGTFKSNEKLSVEQFLTMVVRASGFNPKPKEGEKWSKPFIDQATQLGYIQGNDFVEFNVPITRAEMAKIVVSSVDKITGIFEYRNAEKIKSYIGDYDLIGNGFKDACVKAYDTGIITGYPDGTFKPNNVLTRAEATVVMRRMIDMKERKIINIDGIRSDVYEVNPNIPSELYDYPYQTREWDGWYASNKWMIEKYGFKKVEEFMNIGKGYIEGFYNVNYKTINSDNFFTKLRWYFMPQRHWKANDNIVRTNEDHLKYWANKVIEKQIIINMDFITDTSLIYSNGDTLIRGKAIYTIENCNDMNWLVNYTKLSEGIEIGKIYSCIIEIEITNMAMNEGWDHAERVITNEYLITRIQEVNQ